MVPDSGFRIQDAGFRIQDSGCRIQDSGCRMQDTGYRIQETVIPATVVVLNHYPAFAAASAECDDEANSLYG